MMHSFVAMAIIGVQWIVVGYALSFGKSVLGGVVGWDWSYFGLSEVMTSATDCGSYNWSIVDNALNEMAQRTLFLKVLGSYPAA